MKTKILLLCSLLISVVGMTQINFETPQTAPFGLNNLTFNNPTFPNLVDLDGDGDLDILSGAFNGSFYFAENTGSVSAPNFTLSTLNPFGLVDTAQNSSPTLGDIDGDGDLDLMTGNFNNGFLIYFVNTGTTTSPAFGSASINPWGLSGAGFNSAPVWVDLDNDGDLDLMVGDFNGNFAYYQNAGTAASPAYASPINNPFGLSDVGERSAPRFVDFDNDGDLDMFSGTQTNTIVYFENIGSVTTPAFAAGVSTPFNYTPGFNRATVTLGDLDNDTDLDLLQHSGNDANFVYYENTLVSNVCTVNIPDANFKAALLTNPSINTNNDTEIQCSEATAFTGSIIANNQNITNTTGIEAFTNIVGVAIQGNANLTTVDLSANSNLNSIALSNCTNLSSLTIGANANVSFLSLNNCNFSAIDLSGLTALSFFQMFGNQLINIDLSQNPNISNLDLSDNPLTGLDVSNQSTLDDLRFSNTNISAIDISQNTQLTNLVAFGNDNLTAIDVSNNSSLVRLDVSNALNITSVDLRNGNNTNFNVGLSNWSNTPNLTCVNVDDVAYANVNWANLDDPGDTYSLNCSTNTNQAPTAVCQNITLSMDNGFVTLNPSDIDGGSMDIDGTITSLQVSPSTFNCSNLGSNQVTLTVTDDDGATASCTATVTFEDISAPVLQQPNNIFITNVSGQCYGTPNIAFSATDNCGWTVTTDGPVNGQYPIGTTVITAIATDPSGNTDTKIFNVTVEDTENPIVNIPSILNYDNDPGLCSATPGFLLGASDNCGIDTITASEPAGGVYPVGVTTVIITATDVNGNITTQSFDVTVNDVEVPVISCPANQTVMVAQGAQYVLPDYIADGNTIAMDNCTFTTLQSPAPGTMLGTGTYSIEFEVEDASGNTATCDFELIVDEVLGIRNSTIVDFKLFPNPATTQITVASDVEIATIEIYNLIGQKVLTSTSEILNIEALPSALYLVQIKDVEGNISTKRFIKK